MINRLDVSKENSAFLGGAARVQDGYFPQGSAGTKILSVLRGYLNSCAFYILQILVAAFFVFLKAEVYGAIFFAGLLCVNLVVCDDVRATTLPFLIICTITTNCYNSFDTFIQFVIYAPIALACLVFHFVVYPKRFTAGESAKGIFAVGFAVSFGGMGRFDFATYAYGAYYFFGLGFGMLLLYFVLRSQFDDDSEENRLKFAFLMSAIGVLCSLMVANGYYKLYIEKSIEKMHPYGFSSNNLSTLLMFSMPFPLFLARKKPLAALLSVLSLCTIVLTRSRGGSIFGTLEFVTCASFWIVTASTKKGRRIRLIVCLAVFVAALCFLMNFILTSLLERFSGSIVDETRFTMFKEGVNKFLERPLSGYGLLDHDILYEIERKKGTLTWYHMMIPQVLGGMGLIGVCCYGYQCVTRIRMIFTKPSAWSFVLGLSYMGILMMSQVNPGEFCPLPFEMLTVLLFVLQETRLQTARPLFRDDRTRTVEDFTV